MPFSALLVNAQEKQAPKFHKSAAAEAPGLIFTAAAVTHSSQPLLCLPWWFHFSMQPPCLLPSRPHGRLVALSMCRPRGWK